VFGSFDSNVNNVITNVLDQTDDSPLCAALTPASIGTIQDLLTLDDQGTKNLAVEGGTHVPESCGLLIGLFQTFVEDRECLGDPIGKD
jgi:hypothetical protein